MLRSEQQVGRSRQSTDEICQKVLRCKSTTTNEAVLGELGWWRLATRRDQIRLNYWNKILNMDDTRLTKKIYRESRRRLEESKEKNWCSYTEKLLKKYNLHQFWIDNIPINPTTWKNIIQHRIHKTEELDWKTRMTKKPILRSYKTQKKR